MNIFSLFRKSNESDVINACAFLLNKADVKYTRSKLDSVLQNHIEYPSLLSIKDTLLEYGIKSAAIRRSGYNYSDFETPFICAIQQKDWGVASFTVVTEIEEGIITYLDPLTNYLIQISVRDFELIDKDIILLIDDSEKVDEINYLKNKNTDRFQSIIKKIPLYLLLTIVSITSIYLLTVGTNLYSWIGLGFLISSFIGLSLAALLIWHEIETTNPFLKEVCGGAGKKMNCDAVLNSSKSKFLGITWAIWGFSFMATLFSLQILFANQLTPLVITSLLSILAVPYIIFSIYYQAHIIKQWCPLCLAVQVVIAINAVLGIILLNDSFDVSSTLNYYSISIPLYLGLFFLITSYHAVPLLKKAIESKNYEKRWKRLRYNPDVFQALLSKSAMITHSTEGLGVLIGNPDATNEIVKVCNPYCGPCAKAHPELEHIIKGNTDVKIRVIFTASGEDDDRKTAPVAHLLAIQEKNGITKVNHALDDWYLAPNKDYKAFADKYPMNGELKQQKAKIIAMNLWCNVMKIRATPTIFINGKELPEGYGISELKNFF